MTHRAPLFKAPWWGERSTPLKKPICSCCMALFFLLAFITYTEENCTPGGKSSMFNTDRSQVTAVVLRSQSLCKINMERPGADLLIFLTPFTFCNASETNEMLDKITTDWWEFQKDSPHVMESPFLMKHTNAFFACEKNSKLSQIGALFSFVLQRQPLGTYWGFQRYHWTLVKQADLVKSDVMSRLHPQRAGRLMDQQRQDRQSTALWTTRRQSAVVMSNTQGRIQRQR